MNRLPVAIGSIVQSKAGRDQGRLFLVEGKKTDAGRNRTVPVHQKIATFVATALFIETLAALFEIYKDRFGKFRLHDGHDTSWSCKGHQSRPAP